LEVSSGGIGERTREKRWITLNLQQMHYYSRVHIDGYAGKSRATSEDGRQDKKTRGGYVMWLGPRQEERHSVDP
jgi:hypothetical protein